MKQALRELKTLLQEKDFDALDESLEYIYTSGTFDEHDLEKYGDILQEATLFAEFRDTEYQEEALRMMEEFGI